MSRSPLLVAGALAIVAAISLWCPFFGAVAALLGGLGLWIGTAARPAQRAIFVAVTALVVVCSTELILVAARHLPRFAAASGLVGPARELYMLDRRIIQFETSCARYDSRLGYTLRPGSFRFANTEFDVAFEVTEPGFRDDPASFQGPEIVVIGDSFAMGWGVEQDECFPAVVERLSGRKVLNTAVSSYGTARELRALELVDLSRCEWLIIQFCNNDFFENQRFVREGADFAVGDEAQYRRAQQDYLRGRRYLPGRYLKTLLWQRIEPLTRWRPLAPADAVSAADPAQPDPENLHLQKRQVKLFLKVLADAPVDLSGMKIVVFELNAYNRHFQYFTPLLTEALDDPELPPVLRRIRAVNLAAEIGPEHGFILDDHLNAAGHLYVGRRLLQIMAEDSP